MQHPGAPPLRVVSVFTGAAGLDVGLQRAGAETVAMCESWEPARRILAARFPDVDVHPDVVSFSPTMPYDVLTAGFPCTDLSHAGGKAGIFGAQTGLVTHVFRIAAATRPAWIALENVPNLLHLHGGLGIKTVTTELERLGYRWAYRTLDSRFTGVPQRRNRVIVLASHQHDPAPTLLGQDTGLSDGDLANGDDDAHGFYWTEGRNGLGLIRGAVPTLKGGSTIGLPSAPAIWIPGGDPGRKLLLPSVAAGERLQGFDAGWTDAANTDPGPDLRWKLIGNAVTTGVGTWLGRRLLGDGEVHEWDSAPVDARKTWPRAASGGPGETPRAARVSKWPELRTMGSLTALVDDDWTPLSYRATKGFLTRVDEAGRPLPAEFSADLETHLRRTRPRVSVSAGSPMTRREAAIRGHLDRTGVDYELDVRPVPEVPYRVDIVVRDIRFAVAIRSCYWHGCGAHVDPQLHSVPRWVAKRERVTARDTAMESRLADAGWKVEVVWAHDDPETVARHVATTVAGRTRSVVGRRASPASPAFASASASASASVPATRQPRGRAVSVS